MRRTASEPRPDTDEFIRRQDRFLRVSLAFLTLAFFTSVLVGFSVAASSRAASPLEMSN